LPSVVIQFTSWWRPAAGTHVCYANRQSVSYKALQVKLLGALRHVATDLTPLRAHRDYRLLWAGTLVSTVGRQLTVVAMPYQVWLLTHSALAVGGLGVAQLVPLLVLSLAGGAIADSVDRRRLLIVVNVLLAICSAGLAAAAFAGWSSVAFLYVLAALISGLSSVDGPTRSAVIPNLVPVEQLAAAQALNSVGFQVTLIAGPALAGVILAVFGTGPAYLADAVTFAAAIAAAVAIAPQRPIRALSRAPLGASPTPALAAGVRPSASVPPAHTHAPEPMVQAIVRGLQFCWSHAILRGSFLVDIVGMVFGLRRALFPLLATSVYAAGATGTGLLYAAPAFGAVLAAMTSGWVGRTLRQGWIVIGSVGVFGLSAIWLGFAPSLWVAAIAVAVGGLADGYSVVSRTTVVQTVTPDELRGRISAMLSMSANVGNYLGDIEAGAVANVTSAEFSIVSGGVIVIVSLAGMVAAMPQLRRYRAPYLVAPQPQVPERAVPS
jgi:MFS family permease